MTNNKPIVVMLDFGTASIKGIITERDERGYAFIRNNAEVPSGGCIKRGLIYNLEVTARKTREVLDKLENTIDNKIERVYVAVNGQSLHTCERMVSLSFDAPHEISQEDIQTLEDKLQGLSFGAYQVIHTSQPAYAVNRQLSVDPVGVQAMNVDACYNVILASAQMKENILNVIENKLGLECAGFCIAPTSLADCFLSEDNKRLGCAMVDLGAGVSSVTVYKDGILRGITEIPLGAANITRDLCSLNITQEEAERVKMTHGSCIAKYNDKTTVDVNGVTGVGTRNIARYEINRIIEARTKEIVENIKHYLYSYVKQEELGGLIFLSGGGALLNGIEPLLSEALGLSVTSGKSFGHIDPENKVYIAKPQFHLLYAMSKMCTENCVRQKIAKQKVAYKAVEPEEKLEVELPPQESYKPPVQTVMPERPAAQEQRPEEASPRPRTDSTAKKKKTFFKTLTEKLTEYIYPQDEEPMS